MRGGTYDEGVFALNGDVSDLSVLSESLVEIFGAGAPREATDVNLWVLR